MRPIRTVAALAALALLAAAASAQPVALKRTPKAGATVNYTLEGKLSVQGTDVAISGRVSEKVASVTGDTYVVESTQSNFKIQVMGQEMAQPDTTGSITYKLAGDIVKIESSDGQGTQRRSENLSLLLFPSEPVAPGAKWTREIAGTEDSANVGVRLNFTFVGEETVDGVKTWKLEIDGQETGGDGKIKRTVWLDAADGSVFREDRTYTDVELAGAPGPVSGTFTLRRV